MKHPNFTLCIHYASHIALILYNTILARALIISWIRYWKTLDYTNTSHIGVILLLMVIMIHIYACIESLRRYSPDKLSSYFIYAVFGSMLLLPFTIFTILR